MSATINRTHDAGVFSWIESANTSTTDFPIQNLPFGVLRERGQSGAARCGVAIGDLVLDISCVADVFSGAASVVAYACDYDSLNEVMSLDSGSLGMFRAQLFDLLARENVQNRARVSRALIPMSEVELVMPVRVSGYTDFFASIHHATNAGRLFRPGQPLLPNYKFVPVGYNGRAASVQLGDCAVRRPRGQLRRSDTDVPTYAECECLDYEVELGFFVGRNSERNKPLVVGEAWDHVFGACLLNDWSARDIQAWEAQPLGPFLAKSFATSISPWVITSEALIPFRVPVAARPDGDPAPLPHLWDDEDQKNGALQIEIDALLSTERMRSQGLPPYRLSRSNASALYWTPSQMLAHHTSNGSSLSTGDLIGTGTISGEQDSARGSLLEITLGGKEPLGLPSGEMRCFLEDGDEVTLMGRCEKSGFRSIGFGACQAVVEPSL